MKRIYLAARYSRRDEMMQYATKLFMAGQKVTSRWILGDHELTEQSLPEEAARFAKEDFQDICASEIMVAFTEAEPVGRNRGGRHVEFGIAIAQQMVVIVIGPPENVFHHLEGVIRFDTFDEFMAWMKEQGW